MKVPGLHLLILLLSLGFSSLMMAASSVQRSIRRERKRENRQHIRSRLLQGQPSMSALATAHDNHSLPRPLQRPREGVGHLSDASTKIRSVHHHDEERMMSASKPGRKRHL